MKKGAREKFHSNVMTDYIQGKNNNTNRNVVREPMVLFGSEKKLRTTSLVFLNKLRLYLRSVKNCMNIIMLYQNAM
jgi:hypothetical protein